MCDCFTFKKLTSGKHLWLRNTASTSVSQIVDTTAVILVTHFMRVHCQSMPTKLSGPSYTFIAGGYLFKFLVALFDTPLVYAARRF